MKQLMKLFFLLYFMNLTSIVVGGEIHLNDKVLRGFLNKHCISCHGPKKQKADLRLDKMDFTISDQNEALHYQDFLDALNAGDMPPEDEPQPSFSELELVIGELTEGLFKARKALASRGGKVDMRRLNRREYAGTIRYLFGMEPTPTDIPQDRDIENFDTVGSRQVYTTEHFDLYYELGRKILSQAFKWAGIKQEVEIKIQEPETFWNNNFRRFMEINKDKPKGTKSYRLNKQREEYFKFPHYETGVYLSEPLRHLKFSHWIDPRASYRFSIKAGLQGNVHPLRRFIRVNGNTGPLGVFRVDGSAESPSYSEIEVQPRQLEEKLAGGVAEDRSGGWHSHFIGFFSRAQKINPKDQGHIWIDHFRFEGPFYPEQRSFFDRLLCPEEPEPGKDSPMVWNDENAKELIEKFTFEAFRRRESTSEYIDGLYEYFKNLRGEGLLFNDSMIDTLAIVMASPGFIYHHEKDILRMGKRSLSQNNIASRLSYFLTGGPPDAELYKKAIENKLSNKRTYKIEIDRLLESPKRRRFIEGFVSQWADFVRLDSIKVSDKMYPTYSRGLMYSMKEEVMAYIQTMIDGNMPVSNLIQSDFSIVNAKLASHYGIPGVTSNEFVKVMLPEDSVRGGFLSQGAFHVTGSTGERTSPTVRGMLVMNRFFNDPPPPPPPNVPELGSGTEEPLTSRKLVELHQQQAQCSSCHKQMDSIGLALENFDILGRWREQEFVARKMQPISVEGELKGGAKFKDFREFQFSMLSQEENLARNMVESLMVYAIGRDIEFNDQTHIDKIIKLIKQDGYRMKDMIHAIASSPIFFKN